CGTTLCTRFALTIDNTQAIDQSTHGAEDTEPEEYRKHALEAAIADHPQGLTVQRGPIGDIRTRLIDNGPAPQFIAQFAGNHVVTAFTGSDIGFHFCRKVAPSQAVEQYRDMNKEQPVNRQ